MADEARTRVVDRLGDLRRADRIVARALEAAVSAVSGIPDGGIDAQPVEALEGARAAAEAPLPPELVESAARSADALDDGYGDAGPGSRTSDAGQAAYSAIGTAAAAAAVLFTTGRLMYEGAACDFAVERMKSYADAMKALNTLLAQVIAWELREEGLECHCVCPMCGIGLCGCIWASLHNIDLASGGPGLGSPDDRGVPLRSPPREGSELAEVGARQWDRVSAIDSEPVRTPMEVQAALRKHAIGDEVRIRIEGDGVQPREVTVRHVSDFPPGG